MKLSWLRARMFSRAFDSEDISKLYEDFVEQFPDEKEKYLYKCYEGYVDRELAAKGGGGLTREVSR
ncbi:hypothetical protein LCGC14_0394270 [marine sediment metagenome]|uniref:Uncharacterized protein n=1 Tax=marine sediment metagenome TaxID=412755 RepID=A0A0F9TGQ6_9ZZZZ